MTDTIPAVDPRHAVLVVMDYQRSILANLPDAGGLLDRVAEAISVMRGRNGQVAYVRVALDDADFAAIPETNKTFSALASRAGFLRINAPETAIHDRIAPKPGDIVVRKTRAGAFSTTDLADQLRERGIDTLIMAGVATSGVVLSTVRDAADRDFRIVILSDCCADADGEVHDLLMRKVFPRQAFVITSSELPALLQSD